jgi:hypothetical protein
MPRPRTRAMPPRRAMSPPLQAVPMPQEAQPELNRPLRAASGITQVYSPGAPRLSEFARRETARLGSAMQCRTVCAAARAGCGARYQPYVPHRPSSASVPLGRVPHGRCNDRPCNDLPLRVMKQHTMHHGRIERSLRVVPRSTPRETMADRTNPAIRNIYYNAGAQVKQASPQLSGFCRPWQGGGDRERAACPARTAQRRHRGSAARSY